MSTEDDDDEDINSAELVYTNFDLTSYNKYFLAKSICASVHLTEYEKKDLIITVFGDGSCDSSKRFIEYSIDRYPSSDTKMRLWYEITNMGEA